MSERVESLLAELIQALRLQTEAINELAESNRALVEAMAEADGLDADEVPTTYYLDGRRV